MPTCFGVRRVSFATRQTNLRSIAILLEFSTVVLCHEEGLIEARQVVVTPLLILKELTWLSCAETSRRSTGNSVSAVGARSEVCDNVSKNLWLLPALQRNNVRMSRQSPPSQEAEGIQVVRRWEWVWCKSGVGPSLELRHVNFSAYFSTVPRREQAVN